MPLRAFIFPPTPAGTPLDAGPRREPGGLAPASLPFGAAAPRRVCRQSVRGMVPHGDRNRPPRGPGVFGVPVGVSIYAAGL
jgi:hypothetical protein